MENNPDTGMHAAPDPSQPQTGPAPDAVVGAASGAGSSSQRPPLVRPRQRLVTGVAEGTARHLGWEPGLVRLLFIVSSALFGAGMLLYAWLWALIPTEPIPAGGADRPIRRKFTLAMPLLGVTVFSGAMIVATAGHSLPLWWILLWVSSIAGIAWTLRVDSSDPARTPQQYRFGLFAGPVFVLLFGLLTAAMGERFQVVESALGYVTVILGVVLLLAPPVTKRVLKHFEQRAELAKANQRAEIAAHLHDSVLQTLALIQNRAGATSEVSRIARAQERELRDWLYSGSAPVTEDFATELREIASELELEYGVVFDLVSVGSAQSTLVEGDEGLTELLAAAKEAMLNAARHAGGTVSVYLELTEQYAEVFVRDRGPGFNPEELPADRFGVKNSVIGRMRRLGGFAIIRSAPGEGTQVQLKLPRRAKPATGTTIEL